MPQHKDLKRLIRGVVLSQAYSRSSKWDDNSEAPTPDYFALAQPRILTPRQYGAVLLVASRNPPHWEQWLTKTRDEWKKEREYLENGSNSWASLFEVPTGNYQIPVDEALLFSNNSRVSDDLLRESNDRLLGHLKTIDDSAEAIEAAFFAVLCRPPTDDEKQTIGKYLESRSEDRSAAMKQVVWALITSPEVRFNY